MMIRTLGNFTIGFMDVSDSQCKLHYQCVEGKRNADDNDV